MRSLAFFVALAGCAGDRPPLALAPHVDLSRFMGDWYVIASIPTPLETDAHAAMESYRRAADGSIETTFRYRPGGFDAPEKVMRPRGFVREGTGNAVWGMRFVWPIEADYRIAWVAPDYSQAVIGREARDYAWIMARAPAIPAADLQRLSALLAAQGYDVSRLRQVPQASR
jgi:apolipoprotein D and lipocalin family protein